MIKKEFFYKFIDMIDDPEIDKDDMKIVINNFLNYEEELKMKDKSDGTVYKKTNDDGTESVSHVELNKKKKKKIEILENVPEELNNSSAKILLE